MNPGLSRLLQSRALGAVAAAALAGLLFLRAIEAFPYQFGIDFYQFWGVVVAHRELGPQSTPYADPLGYAQVLNRIADASPNDKLHHANRLRREIEPMATPFLYSAFDLVARDYERAQILHTVLLYAATAIAVFLLARLRRMAAWPAACLALLVPLTFNPFVQDVKYGNVSSFQLLYVVAMLHVAASRSWPRNALGEPLLVGSLAAFVIFKPTTLWIAAAFAVHYAIARGAARALAAGGAAALVSVLALASGAAYFHDAGVWGEWFRFTQGMNGGSLVRTLEQGNLSLPMLLAQRSMAWSLLQYAGMISLWFALALVAAMSELGRRTDLFVPTARRCLADPWCALSIGILFTFATSPLVWAYYHLFALVPIFWLFRREGRWGAQTWSAALCYVACMNPLLEALGAVGAIGTIHSVMLLAWTVLLVGTFAYIVEQRQAASHAVAQATA